MVLKKYRWWKDWDFRLLKEVDVKDAKLEDLEKQIRQTKDRFDNWFFSVHNLQRPTISRVEEKNIFDKVEGGGEEKEIE